MKAWSRQFEGRTLFVAILTAIAVVSGNASPQAPKASPPKPKHSAAKEDKHKKHHKKKHRLHSLLGIHDPILSIVGSNSSDNLNAEIGLAAVQKLDIRPGVQFALSDGNVDVALSGTTYSVSLVDSKASLWGDECTVELLEKRSEDGKLHADDGHGFWKTVHTGPHRAPADRSQTTYLYTFKPAILNFFVSDGHECQHHSVNHHEHLWLRVTYGDGDVYDIDLTAPYTYIGDK